MDQKEFRIARGSSVRQYISQFSATEKAIFGVLVLAALVSALIMFFKINTQFLMETPAYGGSLREGIVGLPRTINPVLAVTEADKDLSTLIYAGLMKYDNGNIIPDLAKSYTVSEDGLTYDFKLKDNISFQDGEPVTADDIVFTIQKIQDPALKSPRRADWVNVTVKAVSQKEVQFVLKQAYSPFITTATVGILPKHIWGNVSDEQFIFSEYNTKPIGAGPYKVSSVSNDQGGVPKEYKLTTWSKYHNKKPYIENLYFVFFGDEEKALNALDTGIIDSLSSISPTEAKRLASDTAQNYKIISTPLPRIFGIFMNQGQSPALADFPARKALDVAVDRKAIIETVLNGYGLPIHSPLPLGILPEQKDNKTSTTTASTTKTIDPNDGNLEEALAILERNGWKRNADGIYEKKMKTGTITLSFDIYTADSPDLKQVAEILKKNWTALGASVDVKIFEASDLYQNIIRPRKYSTLLFGELVGKDRDIYAFWHSSQRNAPGLNVSMYANSAVDKILETIRTLTDEKSKTDKYVELDELIRSDIPSIFLYVPDFIYAVPKDLRGINLGTISVANDRWNSINDWYITTEKVWKIFTNNNTTNK